MWLILFAYSCVIRYVDEESEKIEKLLQQKRSQGHAAAVADSTDTRASGEGGAVGQAKAPDSGDAIDMSLVALALQNLFFDSGGEASFPSLLSGWSLNDFDMFILAHAPIHSNRASSLSRVPPPIPPQPPLSS